MERQKQQQHFLLVTFPAQGHIKPARKLAHRLTRTTGALVTISTTIFAHRRMFPSSSSGDHHEEEQGLICYSPFSDGYDDGFNSSPNDPKDYFPRFNLVGSQTLSLLARTLAARGRPVTCVIYTILLAWAADVASDLGVPSFPFWVMPAAVFSIIHRYFHGYADIISAHVNDPSFSVEFPGLPPLRIRDLPLFLTQNATSELYESVISGFGEMFQVLDRQVTKPTVLINTFDALEHDALISAADNEMDLMAVGPMVDDSIGGNDLFEEDQMSKYMDWLDSKKDKSVVYVSFGSIAVLSKRQSEEIHHGLEESGRPYLWVVRKDAKEKGGGGSPTSNDQLELEGILIKEGEGLVVEWCSQVRVLSHRSIGCFVTHCGWNSTVESIACGVPTVMLPQSADQMTNARMMEGVWGTGMRAGDQVNEEDQDGAVLVVGSELKRCLDVVMGEDEEGVEIRKQTEMWRDRAREAMGDGGSSDRNLRVFVEKLIMDQCGATG